LRMKRLCWGWRGCAVDKEAVLRMKRLCWGWRGCAEDEEAVLRMKRLCWGWRGCAKDEEAVLRMKRLCWGWRGCAEDGWGIYQLSLCIVKASLSSGLLILRSYYFSLYPQDKETVLRMTEEYIS
jgi:hypothetical protein